MKNFGKKVMALGLSLCMALMAVGCGSKNSDSKSDGSVVSKEEKTKMAMEGVYKEVSFQTPWASANIATAVKDGDSYKLYAYVYDNQNYVGVMTCKADGTVTDSKLLTSQLTEEEQTALDKQYNSNNGGDAELYIEGTAAGDVAVADEVMPIDEDYSDSGYDYSYIGYGSLAVAQDGTIYAIRNFSHEISNENGYTCTYRYFLESWDKDGNGKGSVELEGLGYDEAAQTYRYVNDLVPMQDGSIQVIFNGDQYEVMNVAADGTTSSMKKLNIDSKYLDNMERMLTLGNGKVTIFYWDQDWTKEYVVTVDLQTGQAGQEQEIPYSVRSNGMNGCYQGTDTDLIYSNSLGVYTYNFGDAEPVKIMDYINSDLNCTSMSFICSIDADHFIGSYYEETNYEERFGFFTKVPKDQLQEKAVITIAGFYLQYDTNIKNRVIEFNKTSDQYRFTIKDYSTYNTEDDYGAGYTKLNNDIAAGKCPDILVYDTGMSFESYEKKGLFANIDELIAKDSELSSVEFMDNVFEAFRVDGKLYRVIPSFSFNTVLARKDLVGDRTSITLDEAKQVVSSMGSEASLFGITTTRTEYLYNLMSYCGRQFVDPANGVCNFNSQEFKDHLTYMKSLPEEFDYSSLGDSYWSDYSGMYRAKKTLFNVTNFSSAYNIKYTVSGTMGGNVAYVGYPSSTNGGAYISSTDKCLSIAAKSEYLDGAWEFVRYYLTDAYQKPVENNDEYGYSYTQGSRWGNSVVKKYLKQELQQATQKNVYVDPYDGSEYDYDTIWINNEEVHYDPLTQAEVDALFDYICSIKNAYYYNEEINNIINEEAAYFYNNQKSVDDVAAIIQSRIELYVNEQM